MKRSVVVAALALLLAMVGTSAWAVDYKLVVLGSINQYYTPKDINNKGQILTVGNGRSLVWEDDTCNEVAQEFDYVIAESINDQGQVVGMFKYSSQDDTVRAFVYMPGATEPFIDLSKSFNNRESGAFGINNNGQVVGYFKDSIGGDCGFVWSATSVEWVRGLGGGNCRLTAINDTGMAGGWSTTWVESEDGTTLKEVTHPVIRENGECIDLIGFDKYSFSNIEAISNNGQAAGSSDMTSGYTTYCHALYWDAASGILDLGGLHNSQESFAVDINNSGTIIGGSTSYSFGATWGFVIEDGTMRQLESLGGTYTMPVAINDLGWIVGRTTDAAGVQYAVMWQPVPEPSSAAVLTAALSGLGCLGRRRIR